MDRPAIGHLHCAITDGVGLPLPRDYFLIQMYGHESASATHPSTADRLSVCSDFLAGSQNGTVGLLQAALKARGLQALSVRYERPALESAINDIRPYDIGDDVELFGSFEGFFEYLTTALGARPAPMWLESSDAQVLQAVNDLAKKSIRNYSVRERWERLNDAS